MDKSHTFPALHKSLVTGRVAYSQFGVRGLLAAAAAKALHRPVELRSHPRGISHPVFLRAGTADFAVFGEVLENAQYACDLKRQPTVIIDAGSHIGLTSVYFANRYPHARILAIEPEPSNFRLLQKNIAPYPNVRAINAALWHSDGYIRMEDSGQSSWGFRVGGGTGTINAVNLGTLIQRENIDHIDILKMDIEGAELEVFSDNPEWAGKTRMLMIELHDRFRPGCEATVRRAMGKCKTWANGEVTFFEKIVA